MQTQPVIESVQFDAARGLIAIWLTPPGFNPGNHETVLLSLWQDYSTQFGAKFIRGEEPRAFMFDHGAAIAQANAGDPGVVRTNGDRITVEYPSGWVDGIGPGDTLRATVNVDGRDIGAATEVAVLG